MKDSSKSLVSLLNPYSTCDISDALCALLDLNSIGHLPGLRAFSGTDRICGPAYTAEFVLSTSNSPKATLNHVDTCPKGSILVIKAPSMAPNAVWGGLMTARALNVGCKGVVIMGNVRDLNELVGLPVYALGQSAMGAAPFCKLGSVGEPILVAESTAWPVFVRTGDLIVADIDGCVRIPIEHVESIAEYCATRVASDQLCMIDIKTGKTIVETFAKHRGKK